MPSVKRRIFLLITILIIFLPSNIYADSKKYREYQNKYDEKIEFLKRKVSELELAIVYKQSNIDSLIENNMDIVNNPHINYVDVVEYWTKAIKLLENYKDTGLSSLNEDGKRLFGELNSIEDYSGDVRVERYLNSIYHYRWNIKIGSEFIAYCEKNRVKGISKEEADIKMADFEERKKAEVLKYGDWELPNYINWGEGWLVSEDQMYGILYNIGLNYDASGVFFGIDNPLVLSLIPGVGVFALMFLMLGISSSLSTLGTNVGANTLNTLEQDVGDNSMEEDEAKEDGNGTLILEAEIQDKSIVAGDSNTAVVLFAGIRVQSADGNAPNEGELRAAMASIKVKPQGPGAKYIFIEAEDASEWDEWRRFYLYSTYKEDVGLQLPLQIPISVSAASKVQPSNKLVHFKLEKPENRLVIDPKTIVIADRADSHPQIKARILSWDEGNWDYEYSIAEVLEIGINKVEFIKDGDKSSSIKISPLKIPENAGNTIVNKLVVKAINNKTGQVIEEKLTVTVAKEGLVAVCDKPLSIVADGETFTELKITALNAKDGKLHTDFGLLQSVRFEDAVKTQNQLSENAFSTAGIEIIDGGWDEESYNDKNALACYVYRIKTKREIPGQGENYHGELNITSNSEGKEYRVKIPVLLDIAALGPGSKAWEVELERCRKIITKIPKEYQGRMTDLLEKRAQLLGARGLYDLRHKIWKIGQTLWEAEGLSGYEDVERWAGYIENTLNFANWMGKLATDMLLSQYMGVFKAIAAGELYNVIVSGINAYTAGQSFDDWFEKEFIKKHFVEVIQSLGAEGIEQNAEKWFSKNPKGAALAVLAYFSYFFITNMALKKMSVIDAAKAAAQNVAYAGALKFFSSRVSAYFGKGKNIDTDLTANSAKAVSKDIELPDNNAKLPGADEFRDSLDYNKGFLNAKQKINNLSDAIEGGNQENIKKSIMDIKTDKYSIAEINKVVDGKPLYSDDMKKVINDVFDEEIKTPTKKLMDEKVLELYSKKGYKDVELVFESKSNKSDIIKVGSDWDVSYKVKYIDKKGRVKVEDMKARDLKPIVEDSLYQSAGNKYGKGLDKEQFAEELLDVSAMGPDAAGGYGRDVNSALNLKDVSEEIVNMDNNALKRGLDELKRKTDGHGNVKQALSDNAKKVKAVYDKIKLEDPSSLGLGTGYKELEWFNRIGKDDIELEGNMLEGLKQLSKQYNNILTPIKKIADTVSNQKTTKLPSILTDTVDLFNSGKSPQYIEALLKSKGSSLREVADVFKSQVEAYGNAFPNY